MTTQYPKIAILVPTYRRKNGNTLSNLENVFNMLNKQTYEHPFTLFLIGDYYDDATEFDAICAMGEHILKSRGCSIVYHNCDIHFRNGYFKRKLNEWSMGGINAVVTGLQMIYDGEYDYYFHLDDDDHWMPEYIKYIMDSLIKVPETAFGICNAYYKHFSLPLKFNGELKYNNYNVIPCDSVHSSWVVNMKLIGDIILNINKSFLNEILSFKTNPELEFEFQPGDAIILNAIGTLQRNNGLKAVCFPEKYVKKETDGNIPV